MIIIDLTFYMERKGSQCKYFVNIIDLTFQLIYKCSYNKYFLNIIDWTFLMIYKCSYNKYFVNIINLTFHMMYKCPYNKYFVSIIDLLSKFLRRSLLIFIIKVFRTIIFIFIVISTTFPPICTSAFFRCLSNSGTFTELRTTSFIETTGVTCSDSVWHNRVQVLSIPVYYSPVVRIEPATFRLLSS